MFIVKNKISEKTNTVYCIKRLHKGHSVTRLEAFLKDITDVQKSDKNLLEVKVKKVESLQLKIEHLRKQYYDI